MTDRSPEVELSAGRFSTDEQRWRAVTDRDSSADDQFVYAVRTTGIYCRPSCPSRRPRRDHVRFHATCQEAEEAGHRPCRRCRPTEESLSRRHARIVTRSCREIEAADGSPTLDALSRSSGLSRHHFHRVFRAHTGLTPKSFAAACRANRARDELLRASSITQAMYRAGYSSSGRFYETAGEVLGMTPTALRAGGAGATIRFAIGACWLGAILVAATDVGLCAILLGDDPEALVRELQDRFPAACLIGGDAAFEHVVAQVVGLVECPSVGVDLPLDIRGTSFQRRVWEALRAIRPGTTASYAEVAARIGQPGASRAVARACAANSLAVAIPCHRVVRTDGTLSGYRWGVVRKDALLRRERGQE